MQKRTSHATATPSTDAVLQKPVLPAGMPCPHCAVAQKGRAQVLRVLEAGDMQERAYVNSPSTTQHLDEISSRREHSGQALSPLKARAARVRLLRRLASFSRVPRRGVSLDPFPAATLALPPPPLGRVWLPATRSHCREPVTEWAR